MNNMLILLGDNVHKEPFFPHIGWLMRIDFLFSPKAESIILSVPLVPHVGTPDTTLTL